MQTRSRLQQQGSPKRCDERPREGSQRCKYYRKTTLERVSVGVATVAGRGSDRVGAGAGTVLADREKVATTEGVRKEQTTPSTADRSDRDLFLSTRHPIRQGLRMTTPTNPDLTEGDATTMTGQDRLEDILKRQRAWMTTLSLPPLSRPCFGSTK